MPPLKPLVLGLIRNLIWITHPRVPWALAHVLLRRRTRAALASDYRQASALDQMSYLLGDAATPEEIGEAARRYIEFELLEAELRWHPRRSIARKVEGAEHLRAAHAEGRGVILHFAHHGFYSGMFGAVRRATGLDVHVVVRDGALGWNVPTQVRQHMLVVRRGGELVYASEGKEGLRSRLDRGEILAMAADAPGSSVVAFLGHDVTCSSGAVWAAREKNTPIVLVDTWADGTGDWVLRLSPAIHPADHPDPKSLLQLIVARHEEAIRALPEGTFVPTLTWPRADGRPSAAPVRETSVVVPKPLPKALVHNASWLLRPRLPWSVAEKQLARRTQSALASPVYDAIAEQQMTHLLGETATRAEIDAAKERYTRFSLYDAELRWHPGRAIQQRLEGVENLRSAQALGRGVVVSFVHHGHYAGMFGALKRAGIEHVTVVRAGALGWHSGPAQRQTFLVFRRGGELVDVREGIDGFVARLRRGQTVMIATDVPGSSTVTFAGRQVKCSSGAVWAACAADAPIVTVDSWQTEDGPVVRFAEALLPSEHQPQELLQLIVSQHEAAILAWPEASLMPTMSWVAAD